MAPKYKMVAVLVLCICVVLVRCHVEDDNILSSAQLSGSDERKYSDLNQLLDAWLNVFAKEHQALARRKLQPEYEDVPEQYEGLPIDLPGRRQRGGEADSGTTTTTKAVYPPLNFRYRRIFNADETTSIEEFPFMAALLVNKALWCGAVLLDKDTVLTAAHCLQLQYNNRFFREYVKMLTVRVGSTNSTAGGDVFRVTEISFHPNYKPDTLDFNVAVLKLHKNVTLGKKDAPIDLIEYSRDRNVAVDNNVTFLGWGSVLGSGDSGGEVLLQKLTLPVYDLADCQIVYGRDLVTRNNFCAGYITLPKNVCNHDAGGPAVLNGVLVGILSFSSKRCDTADQPAVFTSVGAVAPWLDSLAPKVDRH